MSPTHRTLMSTGLAITGGFLLMAPPALAAKPTTGKLRTCDAVVQRPKPAGQEATVVQAATRIWTRGVACATARRLIGGSILQVGSASPTPPTVCCESSWYANDADWWRKNGWRVERGLGADTKAKDGARFVVTKGPRTIRFTRWS